MDGLHIFLLLGLVSCSHDSVSRSVLEATVRPGDNITLYCDCKLSTGVYIVWYRNCTHENQPSLVFRLQRGSLKYITDDDFLKIFPRFQFVRNRSSVSYDLLITNTTDSDEGLYYCGTEELKVEDKQYITFSHVNTYGNVTRILLEKEAKAERTPVSWLMVFSPAFTILSSFISFILVYHFCQKTDTEPGILQRRPDTRGQTRRDQDEDVYFTRVVFRVKDGQTHQQAEDGQHTHVCVIQAKNK